MHGLELSRRFYFEAVRPILSRRFPDVDHAAGLIGTGSEVLGFDDETSTDHHWGPRVQLFLRDLAPASELEQTLAHELPTEFAGFPTNFGPPEDSGSRLLVRVERGPVAHRVETLTVAGYVRDLIGFDPSQGVSAADWLVTPAQRLLEVTAGDVFADPVGDLTRVRDALAFYPHDVWLLVMSGQWRRIAQLEHFLGRTGLRGDELGSRLIGASLVRDLMRLALLQERRYPPYAKWLGTAYATLGRPEAPALEAALEAPTWEEREEALVGAYRSVAEAHNALGVTDAVEPAVRRFYGRPFRVLFADRFVTALRGAISDPEVRSLDHLAGSIDAVSDNTDVLTRPYVWRRLVALYDRTKPTEESKSDGI